MIEFILSFIAGILVAILVFRLVVVDRLMDDAYTLGLEHAKDMYKRFPNNFIEALDFMLEKEKEKS